MTMFVTPTEVIAGKAKPDKAFAVRFSRQQEDEPMFDDVPYLVAVGDDDDTNRLVLLKPAGEHLAGVAKIAAHSGTQQRNKNAALAANNPEMHPLFEELAKAKHIVLIRFSGDDGGGVSFDVRTRLEEHDNVTVVQSLRGDVKPGEHRRLAFDEGALVGGKDGLLIALFETRNERPVVIATLPANEEMLRVAAAATKKDPAGLLKTAEAAREAYKRERGAARARDLFRGVFGASSGASEPSEGASTPSFDGTPSGEEFERPRAN